MGSRSRTHHKGESLTRLEIGADEVYLGDHAYRTTPGVRHMLENGGTVRTSLQQIRRKTPGNGRIDLSGWLEGLADAVAGESRVGIVVRMEPCLLRAAWQLE